MTLILVVVALLALLFCGLPVAFALAGLGTVMLFLKGLPLIMVAQNLHGALDNFILLSVPLFLLMSNILLKGGVGKDLFDALQSWVGHWRGGLGIAALASCGIFSAISGSSVATAATVATVAVPEMTSRGYGKSFTLGLLAAGGTLGILIPPSIPLIVYGVITEESIGKLFLAGIGPGILLLVLFGLFTVAYSFFSKEYRPSAKIGSEERRRSTIRALPTGGLAILMIGGIYTGAFTPTEASAVGAVFAFLITAFVLLYAPIVTLVIYSFNGGNSVNLWGGFSLKWYAKAVTLYQVPAQISQIFDTQVQSATVFLLIVGLILLFIGLFLESLSMLLIMMPVLFPTVLALGIDPIWFAMYFVILIEVALITPPVGLNLFVIQAVARTNLGTVVRGVLPFIGLMFVALYLIWLFPVIVSFVPDNL